MRFATACWKLAGDYSHIALELNGVAYEAPMHLRARIAFPTNATGRAGVFIGNDAGYPSKTGKRWNDHTIREMNFNEKLAGEMLLQKSYIADPISKQKKKNRGELEQFHVAGSHEPILDRDTYEKVLAEREQRVAKYQPNPVRQQSYPFSSKITCGNCGARFRRKIAGAAPKYKKPVWICYTFNRQGKSHCASRQIPENILMELAADVLGIPAFDGAVFADKIQEIHVPAVDRLVFCFITAIRCPAHGRTHPAAKAGRRTCAGRSVRKARRKAKNE